MHVLVTWGYRTRSNRVTFFFLILKIQQTHKNLWTEQTTVNEGWKKKLPTCFLVLLHGDFFSGKWSLKEKKRKTNLLTSWNFGLKGLFFFGGGALLTSHLNNWLKNELQNTQIKRRVDLFYLPYRILSCFWSCSLTVSLCHYLNELDK